MGAVPGGGRVAPQGGGSGVGRVEAGTRTGRYNVARRIAALDQIAEGRGGVQARVGPGAGADCKAGCGVRCAGSL